MLQLPLSPITTPINVVNEPSKAQWNRKKRNETERGEGQMEPMFELSLSLQSSVRERIIFFSPYFLSLSTFVNCMRYQSEWETKAGHKRVPGEKKVIIDAGRSAVVVVMVMEEK